MLGLALRSVWFVGYANVDLRDDTLYLDLAQGAREGMLLEELEQRAAYLKEGEAHGSTSFVLRPGVYLPVAAAQTILGTNEVSSAIPSLLASCMILILTCHIGVRLAGRATGVLAALLFAVFPLDIVYSTRILADVPRRCGSPRRSPRR